MAGRGWETLGEREAVAFSRLPQIPKERGEIVYQALCWLAREGKIDFHRKQGKTFAPLSQEEYKVFRKFL